MAKCPENNSWKRGRIRKNCHSRGFQFRSLCCAVFLQKGRTEFYHFLTIGYRFNPKFFSTKARKNLENGVSVKSIRRREGGNEKERRLPRQFSLLPRGPPGRGGDKGRVLSSPDGWMAATDHSNIEGSIRT